MAGRTGTARSTAGSLDLASTIRGWELNLRAGGRSPATLDRYIRSARQLVAFLEGRGTPATTAGLTRKPLLAGEPSLWPALPATAGAATCREALDSDPADAAGGLPPADSAAGLGSTSSATEFRRPRSPALGRTGSPWQPKRCGGW